MRISRSARFICLTGASWKKRKKLTSARKQEDELGGTEGLMETIWQDVRFGFRMLMKHRLASLVCIVALALGIGANAAMFSVAEAFLLHPVPFENGDRIVALLDRH